MKYCKKCLNLYVDGIGLLHILSYWNEFNGLEKTKYNCDECYDHTISPIPWKELNKQFRTVIRSNPDKSPSSLYTFVVEV